MKKSMAIFYGMSADTVTKNCLSSVIRCPMILLVKITQLIWQMHYFEPLACWAKCVSRRQLDAFYYILFLQKIGLRVHPKETFA